jgi:hypothetical protein
MSGQCYADYFKVVLEMSTALGYEFDECAARVEFEGAVDISNTTAKMICITVTTNRIWRTI